jgi:hypothetical protein
MLWKRFTEERGVAMITALLTSMVVLSLGLVVVGLSEHNSYQSSRDRNRTQAIDAAEGGIDATLFSLGSTALGSLPCTIDTTLPTTPAAKYHVAIDYYSTYPPSGSALACPLPANTVPAGATITSTGTAVVTTAPLAVSRTMETQVRLTPIRGGFGKAIFSDTGLNLQNNLTVNGNVGNDGDLYTNGNFTCGNSSNIKGSVNAQGTGALSNSCTLAQDFWVNGTMTMTQTSSVGHDATSSVSSLTMSNSSRVLHNARTGTTCSGCTGRVTGSITQNSVSPAPPKITLPVINYDSAAWQAAGYTISPTTTCAAALPLIIAGVATPTVFRLTPGCALSFSNNTSISLKSDLAIITDGSITTVNQTTWTSFDGNLHQVFFIAPTSSAPTCPTSGVTHDISVSNNTSFDTNLKLFGYTPCTITFSNNNNGKGGQLIGGTVDITNLYALSFFPMIVPGAGPITGFNVDIAFLREITNPAT